MASRGPLRPALAAAAATAAATLNPALLLSMPFTSPLNGKASGDGPQDEEWARVLQRLVQILSGYAPLRFVPFYVLKKHGETEANTPRRWRTVLGLEEIQYLPEDVDDPDRDVSLGRTAHEVWHVLFSRPELIFDEPELIKSMAFQALWWSVEDPRVNTVGLRRHPGARRWIDAAYEKDYAVRDLEAERAQWTREIPLHLQFNYALIYEWWAAEPDPRVTDPRVRQALDQAGEAIRRAYGATEAARSFAIVRDEIWPIYKELVDEAYDQEQQKNDQQQGDSEDDSDGTDSDSSSSGSSGKPKPSKGGQKGKPQPSKGVKEKMEKLEREQRDKHASKMVDKPEKMSQAERERMKKELEEMRKKMGQKQEGQEGKEGQQGQKAQGQAQGEGEGQGEGKGEMSAEQKAKQRERLSKADEREENLKDSDQDQYQKYYDRIKRLVPVMRQQFLQVLKRKIRRRTIHDRRSGELDEENMADLPAGKPDPFVESMSANKSLYRVSLLIDTSGSMSGEKRERAVEGAVMLMESLEKLPGVVYEIVAFDDKPRVVKAYQERVTPAVKSAVVKALLRGSGSTESHVAVQEALQRIRMGRGEKLMIMVNDGDPDNNFDRDQYRAMLKAAKDVDVHGIGLGPEAQLVLDLFPPGRGWWLKDAADFAKNLRNIIKKKLLGE